MLTSFSEFKLTLTTLLLTVLVPLPMLEISDDKGLDVDETLTPSFFRIELTLFVLMLMPPAVTAGVDGVDEFDALDVLALLELVVVWPSVSAAFFGDVCFDGGVLVNVDVLIEVSDFSDFFSLVTVCDVAFDDK